MRKSFFITSPLVLLLVISAFSCNHPKPTDSATSGKLTLICDENIKDVMQQEEGAFEFTYPKASINTVFTTSSAAMDSLMALKTSLIVSTSPLTEKQKETLNDQNCVPYSQLMSTEAVAFVVNKNNTVEELAVSDLKDLLSGTAKKWRDIEPSKLSDIKILTLEKNTPLVKYLTDSILNGKPLAKEIVTYKSYKEILKAVENDKNAIGIVGVSSIMKRPEAYDLGMAAKMEKLQTSDITALDFISNIKVLKIRKDTEAEGYQPYQVHIYNGDYPFYISYYVTSTSPMGGLSRGYLAFLTGFLGQKIIQTCGMLPCSLQPRLINNK